MSKKCDQETLPPIKTSLLDALQAARDEIAEMSERADQMTRRQEQSRESIARRLGKGVEEKNYNNESGLQWEQMTEESINQRRTKAMRKRRYEQLGKLVSN